MEAVLTPAEGHLIVDADGRITFASDGAEALLAGPGCGSTLGRAARDFFGASLRELAPPGVPGQRFEVVLLPDRGQPRRATASVVPLQAADGTSRLVTFAVDAPAGDELRTHAQKLVGLGTIAAGVAHELNNPISIITATCDNLRSSVLDSNLSAEAVQRYVDLIEHSAWRCARIVETLRTYSDRRRVQLGRADLNEIIQGALAHLNETFRAQHRIRLHSVLAQSLPPVLCDRNQITQVLINLLTNARDALRAEDGEVEVRSWPSPDGNHVGVTVSDSGSGIPSALMERIFEPFFTTKSAGDGTGLGLSIVAGIVEQNQGRVLVRNRPEGGAQFTVLLPSAADS